MGARRVTFVDLGAYTGDSTRLYERTHDVAYAYLWECNPDIAVVPPKCPHEVIRAAAWVEDGTAPFYLGNHNGAAPQGSTLVKDKTTGWLDYDNPVTVETVDLSQWLAEEPQNDPIAVKMNIEGAEYDVMEHLCEQGALELVTEWHISFHNVKVGRSEFDDEVVRECLRQSGYSPCASPFPGCEGWRR